MKALECTRPGKLEYKEIARPVLKKGQAIIRIRNIGVCGTDLHAYEGTQPFFEYPRILGHELSGELADIDGAPGFNKGETVTFLPYLNCGHCIACRNGKTNCCVNLKTCGVHIDGGMTEYYSVPSRLLLHSQGLTLEELAVVEPLSIGAHGIRRAAVQAGEFVLVMGAGPIGLAALQIAGLKGANLIVMDQNAHRLNFCGEVLGLSHIIDVREGKMKDQLLEITSGDMPAVVIDATGNRKAINTGLSYLAHGGRYILIGLQKEEINLSHPEFHKREATLMSSRNATRADFEEVILYIQKKMLDPGAFITNRVKFSQVARDFSRWLDPAGNTIKVMIENDE